MPSKKTPQDAFLSIKTNKVLKQRADVYLKFWGINMTQAFNIFLRQICINRGLPFPLRMPSEHKCEMEEVYNHHTDNTFSEGDILAQPSILSQDRKGKRPDRTVKTVGTSKNEGEHPGFESRIENIGV